MGLRVGPDRPSLLVFSTDDMRAAYRQVPPSDPEMCIVCIYSFDRGEVGPRSSRTGVTTLGTPAASATTGVRLSCAVRPLDTSWRSPSIIIAMTMLPRTLSPIPHLIAVPPAALRPCMPLLVSSPSRTSISRLRLSIPSSVLYVTCRGRTLRIRVSSSGLRLGALTECWPCLTRARLSVYHRIQPKSSKVDSAVHLGLCGARCRPTPRTLSFALFPPLRAFLGNPRRAPVVV